MKMGLEGWHASENAESGSEMTRTQTETGKFEAPAPDELAGLFPQLEILRLIGQGGMGAVYEARQKSLDRTVALKITKPDAANDSGFAERFAREAKALARLSHQNIVTVHDFGRTDGLYYFVMEYVDGVNLRQMIAAGNLEPRQALQIIPHICDALQYAHDEGIVHRDIKPENILIDEKGRVKIADFGLAKLIRRSLDDHSLTGTRQVMGTPRYMAPEQMEGSREIDHRADIYSLGVVFYEMLTGELPIGRFALPSQKTQIDEQLDEVVLRTLEKEPGRRYQHASELKSDVQSLHAGIVAPQPPKQIRRDFDGRSPLPAGVPALPRFSRKAIFGAAWAPFFFIAVLCSMIVTAAPIPERQMVSVSDEGVDSIVLDQTATSPGRAWWQWFLIVGVLPLGLSAPFGTTTLGVMAISDIRHSQGRLTGLPIAVGDALLFPLLILDALIFLLAISVGAPVLNVMASIFGIEGRGVSVGLVALFAIPIPIILVIDALIVWGVWKKVASPAS
jgi:predicted Ser/Thr protein kinase